MMPSHPASGLVLVQPHIAFFSLELGFNAPPRPSHVGESLQGSVLWGVGQVVAGLAAVPVPVVDGPVDFARLPPAGQPHPLGAELVAAGHQASSGKMEWNGYQSIRGRCGRTFGGNGLRLSGGRKRRSSGPLAHVRSPRDNQFT